MQQISANYVQDIHMIYLPIMHKEVRKNHLIDQVAKLRRLCGDMRNDCLQTNNS